MKRTYFLALLVSAFMFSCSDSTESIPQEPQIDMSDFYLYTADDNAYKSTDKYNGDKCYTMKVLNKQLKENPGLYDKMYNIEKHTRTFIASKKGGNKGGRPGGGGNDGGGDPPVDDNLTISIPVYVYVILPNPSDISDEQVASQIEVLNADFNDTEYGDVPTEFRDVASNIEISFTLGPIDRKTDDTAQWGTNDAVKFKYPAEPGYLTIWVANIGNYILGYAQFPGGDPTTDGVVIAPPYFGTFGTAKPPFDLGRTTTHEVGHWLNLRHIWGDGRCRQDDFVADTPSSDRPNYGCPNYPTVHCRTNDMTMNYMDYTDDACMYMFTEGQKARMRAIFTDGGPRENFIK